MTKESLEAAARILRESAESLRKMSLELIQRATDLDKMTADIVLHWEERAKDTK